MVTAEDVRDRLQQTLGGDIVVNDISGGQVRARYQGAPKLPKLPKLC